MVLVIFSLYFGCLNTTLELGWTVILRLITDTTAGIAVPIANNFQIREVLIFHLLIYFGNFSSSTLYHRWDLRLAGEQNILTVPFCVVNFVRAGCPGQVVNTCDQLWQYCHHKTVLARCLGTLPGPVTSVECIVTAAVYNAGNYIYCGIQDVWFYMEIIVKIGWYLRSWNISRNSVDRSLSLSTYEWILLQNILYGGGRNQQVPNCLRYK